MRGRRGRRNPADPCQVTIYSFCRHLLSGQPDVAIGTYEKEARCRDAPTRELLRVDRILGNVMDLDLLVNSLPHPLTDRDEAESRIVAAREEVLRRSAGGPCCTEPREAIARVRCLRGWRVEVMRQRAVAIADSYL